MSTTIESPVETIRNLRINSVEKLPSGKPLDITKFARVGNTFLFVTADGAVYSNAIRDRLHYHLALWWFNDSLMRALRACGVITSAQMKEHLRCAKEHDASSKKRSVARRFKEAAERFGVPLSSRQAQDLRRALGEE